MPKKVLFSKEVILDTAFRLFKEEGYDAISARNVGRMLDASPAPIYKSIGSMKNLKKELMEVIFSENLNIFKKSIFIQGVFTYANLILSNNATMTKEEKTKIMEEIVEISNLLADETLEDVKKYAN